MSLYIFKILFFWYYLIMARKLRSSFPVPSIILRIEVMGKGEYLRMTMTVRG